MQVGRVRADFQERLLESTRQMVRAVAARYDAVARRLISALEQSERQHGADGDGTVVLAAQEQVLRRIMAELSSDDADRNTDGRAPDLSSEEPGTGW